MAQELTSQLLKFEPRSKAGEGFSKMLPDLANFYKFQRREEEEARSGDEEGGTDEDESESESSESDSSDDSDDEPGAELSGKAKKIADEIVEVMNTKVKEREREVNAAKNLTAGAKKVGGGYKLAPKKK